MRPIVAASVPPGSLHGELRMLNAERLHSVAVPADGLMRGEHIRQRFGPHVGPLHCVSIRAHQRRLALVPVDFSECLAAARTGLALVPVGRDVAEKAIGRSGRNLAEALLAAILAFRPACAGFQLQHWLAEPRRRGVFRALR